MTSARIRARLALVVLLSELFFVLAGAPSAARHAVHRATTIDAVTSHAASARLPKAGDPKVHRAGAREAACVLPNAAPVIARASWERASFVHASDHVVFSATCEPHARGPPVFA